MKAIVINLLKSFWLAKGKLLLCVVASILCAWGISTMLYSKVMTDRDFEKNFNASNPADMIITISNPSAATINQLSSSEQVEKIERREAITCRIKNRNGLWMSLLVFAGDNIGKTAISKFDISGAVNDNAIFIERNGLSFLDTSKSASIQLGAVDTFTLSYAGRAFDPGLPPSQMEQMVYGYTSITTIRQFLNKNSRRYLIKLKQKNLKEEKIREIGKTLTALVARSGSNVTSLVIPPPGEHPHQNIVNGISFLQKSFGIILSLLGVILLSLILITWLYPQIVTVGIMKTVGASARMVFNGYILVLLLIIVIGILIGLPLGYATAKMYSRFIDFIQNFKPVDLPLPLSDHLVIILPIVAIPMLFTAIPLFNIAKTSVYQALNKVFYTPYHLIFKLTNRVFSNSKIKYSINNLFRSNLRTSLLVLLLIAGIALFTAGFNLEHSLKTDFKNYLSNSAYGITVTIKDSLKEELSFLKALSFVEKVEYIKNLGIQFKSTGKSYYENSVISNFSPGYELNNALLIKGEIKPLQTNYLYFSQEYADDFKDVPLGGIIELKYWAGATEKFAFGGVIKNITHSGFYRFANTANSSYNELAIKIKDNYPAENATKQLDDALMNNDINVKQIFDSESRLLMLENHLKPTYFIIQVMGIITLVIALTGLLIVLNLSLQERLREMGIMKAMGGTVWSIVNMYLREYLFISVISLTAGIFIGRLLNAAICNLFGVMVIQVPVQPLVDNKILLFTIISFLAVQNLLISIYIRTKVIKASASMLSRVF